MIRVYLVSETAQVELKSERESAHAAVSVSSMGEVLDSVHVAPRRPTSMPRRFMFSASFQGLTLVHFSAQLEPCLSQGNTLHTLSTPLARATQPLRAPPIPYKALKLS